MRTHFCSTLRSLTLPLALACCSGVILPTAAIPSAAAEYGFGAHANGHSCSGHGCSGHGCSGHGNRATRAGNQLGRWLGIGWGDGYHTCQPRAAGHHADAPPPTYYNSLGHYASPHYSPSHYGPQLYDPEYARLPWLAAAQGLAVPPAPVPVPPIVAGQPVASPARGPLQR